MKEYANIEHCVSNTANNMDLDPRDKIMLDALHETTARESERRRARRWGLIGASGVGLMMLDYIESIPEGMRTTAYVVGGFAVLFYLAYLSTTDFGKMIARFFHSPYK